MAWTAKSIEWLKENYPTLGRKKCAELLAVTESTIRSKASRLGLKSKVRHTPETNKQRGDALRGKKRPEHSRWMKKNFVHTPHSAKTLKKMSRITKHRIEQGKMNCGNRKGCKLTQSHKDKISRAGIGREVSAATRLKIIRTRFKNYGTVAAFKSHGNWKAGWRQIGRKRIFARSRWEANYARYLETLRTKGQLKSWKHESKTFWFTGEAKGVCYLPDFKVTWIAGRVEFHEVKGWMCARSIQKLALMEKHFPEVRIIIIDAKWFKTTGREVREKIQDWER